MNTLLNNNFSPQSGRSRASMRSAALVHPVHRARRQGKNYKILIILGFNFAIFKVFTCRDVGKGREQDAEAWREILFVVGFKL